MTAKAKTGWYPPELIVVTRGQPEESVLAACKGSLVFDGPRAAFEACLYFGSPCSSIGDS